MIRFFSYLKTLPSVEVQMGWFSKRGKENCRFQNLEEKISKILFVLQYITTGILKLLTKLWFVVVHMKAE